MKGKKKEQKKWTKNERGKNKRTKNEREPKKWTKNEKKKRGPKIKGNQKSGP